MIYYEKEAKKPGKRNERRTPRTGQINEQSFLMVSGPDTERSIVRSWISSSRGVGLVRGRSEEIADRIGIRFAFFLLWGIFPFTLKSRKLPIGTAPWGIPSPLPRGLEVLARYRLCLQRDRRSDRDFKEIKERKGLPAESRLCLQRDRRSDRLSSPKELSFLCLLSFRLSLTLVHGTFSLGSERARETFPF